MAKIQTQNKASIAEAISVAVEYTRVVILRSPGIFLGFALLDYASNLFFGGLQSEAAGNMGLVVLSQLSLLVVSLVIGLVFLFLVPLRVNDHLNQRPNSSFWEWSNRLVWPLTLESLRVFARLILWSILLILPGFYWYIRYLFVPYVVLLDDDYSKGKVDALKRSIELTKTVAWPLIFFELGISILSLAIDLSDSYFHMAPVAILRAIITPVELALSLYGYCVIFEIFRVQNQILKRQT